MGENDETVPEAELAALAKHHLWAKEQTARWNRRAAILRGVERFKLTENQGEILCRRRGVGPLNPRPNPAEFDIWSVSHWPVTWVLAWIIFRDEEHVRHCWPEYMQGYHVWREHRIAGRNGKPERRRFLIPQDLTTIVLLGIEACLYSGAHLGLPDAQKDLFDKLKTGTLECTGRPAEGGARRVIPATEFIDAELIQDTGDLAAPKPVLMKPILYIELRFASAKVRQLWPVVGSNSAEQGQKFTPDKSAGVEVDTTVSARDSERESGSGEQWTKTKVLALAEKIFPEGKKLPPQAKKFESLDNAWRADEKCRGLPPPGTSKKKEYLKDSRFQSPRKRRRKQR